MRPCFRPAARAGAKGDWPSACFGSRRSRVRILPSRPGPRARVLQRNRHPFALASTSGKRQGAGQISHPYTDMARSIAGITLFLALLLAPLYSQVVVFNFGSSNPDSGGIINATSVDANITAVSSFSSLLGSGIVTKASPQSTTSGGSGGYYFTSSYWRTSDSNYYEVTITPSAGYQVTLSSFDFYYLSTSSGPDSSALKFSDDSFNSTLASYVLTKAVSTPAASDWRSASQSITATFTSSTTFRLYATGASSSAGAFRIDDVQFIGTVTAVPEPSTYAAILGGVALVGVMVLRRRKSAANAT